MQPWKAQSKIESCLQRPLREPLRHSITEGPDGKRIYDALINPLLSDLKAVEQLVQDQAELLRVVRDRMAFVLELRSLAMSTMEDVYETEAQFQLWKVLTLGIDNVFAEGDPRTLLTMAFHELAVLIFQASLPDKRPSQFTVSRVRVIERTGTSRGQHKQDVGMALITPHSHGSYVYLFSLRPIPNARVR